MILDRHPNVQTSDTCCVHVQRALLVTIAPGESRARPLGCPERPRNKLNVVNLKIIAKAVRAHRMLKPAVDVGLQVSLY